VRRRLPAVDHAGGGGHARPLHAGVRARRRRDGRRAAYRRALTLLAELFPLGDAPAVETTRQRTLQVGARLERAALAPPQAPATAPEEGSIALGIDAGHVRSVRRYRVRSFEVFVAQVGAAEGKPVVFGGVPAEATGSRSSCAACCSASARRRARRPPS
jgi:hypothetical protein